MKQVALSFVVSLCLLFALAIANVFAQSNPTDQHLGQTDTALYKPNPEPAVTRILSPSKATTGKIPCTS